MAALLPLFILVPFVGFLISLLIPATKESLISGLAMGIVGAHLFGAGAFVVYWLLHGHPLLNSIEIDLYRVHDYDFFIDLYFDKITVAYLMIGGSLTFLATIYSRHYLYRESGYKRFFTTVHLFYLGYTLLIFAGNLETTFIGWEILGITSFLLIAFYRNRYLPVKNAVKAFSMYQLGDVGIILAIWMSRHLWYENVTFYKFNHFDLVQEHAPTHTLVGVFISLMILMAAAARSAQLPFSSWLPRAMEGSTPSSALFYGSLSVHIGVFLLLRTKPFWQDQLSVKLMIGLVGAATSIVATLIARVQSFLKSQIAYLSIAQIGLIFIEVAAGFETLALMHVVGNALLRAYQLLVSPVAVSYLIREQLYNFIPRTRTRKATWPKKIAFTMYMLSLKEWNLDSILYQYLWNPLKWIGRKMNFLTVRSVLFFFILGYLSGLFLLFNQEIIPPNMSDYLPALFALIGLVMVVKSFTESKNVWLSWLLVLLNHFWIALTIGINERLSISQICFYLGSVVGAGIGGLLCLQRLRKLDKNMDLDRFHGYVYKHPKIAFLFLMAGLGLAGFPVTPTFIGEDLILTHIHEDQTLLAFFIALCFIINGLAVIRIYARVFLGPHTKSVYEIAYRSS